MFGLGRQHNQHGSVNRPGSMQSEKLWNNFRDGKLYNAILPNCDLLHSDTQSKIQCCGHIEARNEELSLLRRKAFWHGSRHSVHLILDSGMFQLLIGLMVSVQLILNIYVVDLTAPSYPGEPAIETPAWVSTANWVFLGIYTLELLARFYVYRSSFWNSRWHWLDLFVVLIDLATSILSEVFFGFASSNMSVCRLFRVLKVARAARMLQYFPEIFIMVQSLVGALRRVFWASLLITFLVIVWALIAVSIIHPLNLDMAIDGCKDRYSSVWEASLLLFQILVTGDEFATCTIPIIRKHPWTLLYFMGAVGTISLGMMNLLLSAIVDRAAEVREQNAQLLHLANLSVYEQAKKDIVEVLMKDAKEGRVVFTTVTAAYNKVDAFKEACENLDASSSDLVTVFLMMDDEEIGEVHVAEFADHLFKLKIDTQHSTVVMIRQEIVLLKRHLFAALKGFPAHGSFSTGQEVNKIPRIVDLGEDVSNLHRKQTLDQMSQFANSSLHGNIHQSVKEETRKKEQEHLPDENKTEFLDKHEPPQSQYTGSLIDHTQYLMLSESFLSAAKSMEYHAIDVSALTKMLWDLHKKCFDLDTSTGKQSGSGGMEMIGGLASPDTTCLDESRIDHNSERISSTRQKGGKQSSCEVREFDV